MNQTHAKPLHVVVVGAGSMGSLVGGLLAEGGLQVSLVTRRSEHPDAIVRQGGLIIVGHGGTRCVPVVATTDAGRIENADVVIFLCKAHSTREAAESCKHLFADPATIALSLQNGLGSEDEIARVIGDGRVLGGLTALGARLEVPGTVRSFANLPTFIGELAGGASSRSDGLAREFTRCGLPTEATVEIMRKKWQKLFANVAFSATSGATGLTISEVGAVPELRAAALRAIDEAAAVAAATGMATSREERLEIFESLLDPAGAGANTTSMFRDLAAGRETEVDFIYGTILRIAERHGVATPTLQTLAALIKGLEKAKAAWRPARTTQA